MHVHHRGTGGGSGVHRLRHGVGNVVEFAIQEDRKSQVAQIGDDVRTGVHQQLQANFHPWTQRHQLLCQREGFKRVGIIQRDNQTGAG